MKKLLFILALALSANAWGEIHALNCKIDRLVSEEGETWYCTKEKQKIMGQKDYNELNERTRKKVDEEFRAYDCVASGTREINILLDTEKYEVSSTDLRMHNIGQTFSFAPTSLNDSAYSWLVCKWYSPNTYLEFKNCETQEDWESSYEQTRFIINRISLSLTKEELDSSYRKFSVNGDGYRGKQYYSCEKTDPEDLLEKRRKFIEENKPKYKI